MNALLCVGAFIAFGALLLFVSLWQESMARRKR